MGALTRLLALLCANALALLGFCMTTVASRADVPAEPPPPRIEARSNTLLAVGIVHGDRMTIHLSRLMDNAPVRDAALTVLLRGVVHPTTAEADGSYTLQTKDLSLPGSAAVIFQVVQGNAREDLQGALRVTADRAGNTEEKNSARQLGWWVLNFAVCIGFLMLISRRRKAAAKD